MKKLSSLLVVALLAAVLFAVPSVSAHDGEDHSQDAAVAQSENEEAETTEEAAPAEETSSGAYNYVAQEGDSYSVMARKAVQTYGIINSVNLSGAEIVFAETNLTRTAGSPAINAGQEVSINVADVQKWVEAAQALSDAEEALWEVYVPFVDFNTDAVGETRS